MTRRELLAAAAGIAVSPAMQAPLALAQGAGADEYRPFRVGIQSYSLRHYRDLDDALARTRALGLRYWEGWDGHLPVTTDAGEIASYRRKLAAHGIRMPTYGVEGFSADEADARRKFEFARQMGVRTISASPSPDCLGLLDRLANEYRINIAIHNHGPGDNLYDTWEKVLAAVQGRSARIGMCLDTGHLLRSHERPETAAGKFGDRIYGVHLKDVKYLPGNGSEFVDLGEGTLDMNVLLRALMDRGYPQRGILAVEYEQNEQNPIAGIEKSLTALRHSIHTITSTGILGTHR